MGAVISLTLAATHTVRSTMAVLSRRLTMRLELVSSRLPSRRQSNGRCQTGPVDSEVVDILESTDPIDSKAGIESPTSTGRTAPANDIPSTVLIAPDTKFYGSVTDVLSSKFVVMLVPTGSLHRPGIVLTIANCHRRY